MTMRFFAICFKKKEHKNFWAKCREDLIIEKRRATKEILTGIPELCRPWEHAFEVKTLLAHRNKIEFLV